MVLAKQNQNKVQHKDPSPPPKVQLKTEGHYYLGKARQEINHSKINLNRSVSQKGES
jgi:biopolymer transport protein ExbD